MISVLSNRALEDVRRQFRYVVRENPPAAERILRRIEEARRLLEDFPYAGRLAGGGRDNLREFAIGGTRLILVYRVREETIQILRVFHGAQAR